MKSITLNYPAKIEHRHDDGDYFFVSFRDIENCFTQGETYIEALDMAQDVLGFMLQDYVDDNKPLPKMSKAHKDEVLVAPYPEIAAPLLLYLARKSKHISQKEAAKRLGVSKQRYSDIEHGKNLTMKTLNKVAQTAGFKPMITLTAA